MVALAYAAGFSLKDAKIIGREDQHIDDDPKTSPFAGVEARALWHFTTPERRDEIWSMFEWAATTEVNNFAYYDALKRLGGYFHAEQDSFAHEGFGPGLGHLFAGHAPDKTFNDVPRADRMARDTFDKLVQARNILGRRFAAQVSNNGVPWNETLAKYVHDFNTAREGSQKTEILQQLIHYIQHQRQMVEQEPEDTSSDEPRKKQGKRGNG
jgi:hypothetical protein